jgi:oxygen-dependent protoporphyrinogen oxidase
MGRVVEALARQLATALRLDEEIVSLAPRESGFDLTLREGETVHAAQVALAAPAHRMAPLVRPWNPGLADLLAGIEAASVAVCAVGYRRVDLTTIPTGFGYLAPERLERPVLGAIYSSSIFPEQAPPDGVQIRAILGGWRRPEVANWSNEQLIAAVRADLKAALGIVAEPEFTECKRWERAIPQYFVGHLERLRRIGETAPRGLHFLGASYRGVAVADCVRDAAELSRRLVAAPMSPTVPAGSAT